MRSMASDFFAASPVLAMPVIAMLLFGVVFALVVARALRAERRHLEQLAALPLETEDHD